ncbi:MAG: glycoside-pentoside-hexuronide (GPH):cation symporter [Clostridiales bacterium]|nr:glycoside-pentoside-hexuronide (GPH):cation symporter [Clostridiales bacterium]
MGKKNKSEVPAKKHPNAIGVGEAFGYMFGDMGNLFVLTFVSTYLKVFYTDCLLPGHGADASKISTDLTVLFLVIRLWDAVNDPVWGLLIDTRKPSKNGKFRPYLKVLAVPMAIAMSLCFLNIQNVVSSYALLLAFAYITYCIYGMVYTAVNIPYGSLASAITDDPNGRTLLSTFRSIGGGIGGGAVTLVVQGLVYDNGTTLNPQKTFVAACTLSALAIAAYLTCYKTTKERVHYSTEKKKLNIKLTYGSLFKSRPFITMTVAGMLISGLLQFTSFNQYLTKNYFGNSNLSILLTMSTYAPMVALILFVPKLAARFGKKELCESGLGLATVSSIVLCFIGPSEYLQAHPWPYVVINFAVGAGYCFLSILTWALVTDVIDYQENVTGVKNESAIYAVYTFARKFGQTLADAGGLQLLYKYAKYDPESTTEVGYIPGVGDKIYKMVTRVMVIAYGVTFLMFIIYPLDKKRLDKLHAELMEKRAETEPVQEQQVPAGSVSTD